MITAQGKPVDTGGNYVPDIAGTNSRPMKLTE